MRFFGRVGAADRGAKVDSGAFAQRGIVERLRALDEMMIQRLRAVGESAIERDRVLLEYGLQVLGAVDERGIELQELVVAVSGTGGISVALSYLPGAAVFAVCSASQAILYWELAQLRDGAAPGEVDDLFS